MISDLHSNIVTIRPRAPFQPENNTFRFVFKHLYAGTRNFAARVCFTRTRKALFTAALPTVFLAAQRTSHYGGYWTPGGPHRMSSFTPYPPKQSARPHH